MWLKKSQTKIGYERSVSIKQPILANIGKDCYLKCHKEQGPCKWCGKEGFCCTQRAYYAIKNGCDGTFGGKRGYECVLKPGDIFLKILLTDFRI